MTSQAKKITFSDFFSSVAHLQVETKLFCYYQNFISSAVKRNHGGLEKALHQRRTNDDEQTTNEQTNDEQRTTLTIIIPRQDSQNPRANNTIF